MKKTQTNESNNIDRDIIVEKKDYELFPKEEQEKWTAYDAKNEKIPLWSKIALSILLLSAAIYVVFCFSPRFADFFNQYNSGAIRFLLAQITNLLPFSLTEALIFLIPVILFLAIRHIWKYKCHTRKSTLVTIVCIFSIASMFLSSFVWTFAAGYRGTTLDKKLDLDAEPIGRYDLYNAAVYLAEEINKLAPEIEYDEDGFSVMPYTMTEMNDKLLDAYKSFADKHNFINTFYSRLKPVFISEGMSYAHITGVYTFFTGESNLNVGFPDYTIPYTAAHELAHQRGIAREDEANMIALLVCLESDDKYIRYSAYLNMYEYIVNALYDADYELFLKVNKEIANEVHNEQVAYNKFFKKYSHSVTSQISGAVNDAYLQSQGTVGKKSYGMVVDLTVAYLKKCELIPKQN